MHPQRMATRIAIDTKPVRVILASAILPPDEKTLQSASQFIIPCIQTDEFPKMCDNQPRVSKFLHICWLRQTDENFQDSAPASNPISADPPMIHRVSRSVNAMKTKLAQAIAAETGPCRASRASGIVADPISPAAAKVNDCIELRMAGRSTLAPT